MKITLRQLIVRTACLLVVPCLGTLRAADARAPEKPNVVFILADDLGWSDTTLYGTTQFYQTPNIQRLAERGMVFTDAYAANPLCSPTRASIMTGMYPARIGITTPSGHVPVVKLTETMAAKAPAYDPALQMVSATRLNTTYYTLAKALHDAGYATGHYGKWHLGTAPYSPLQQGFDVDVPHWWGPGPAGCYIGPWDFPDKLHFVGQPGEQLEDRMCSEAMKFISANGEHPFFLNYWAFSVHAPFDAKAELIKKYEARVNPNDEQRCPVYGGMVESLDQNVGRLLNTLDELHLAQNTIIVFFSDNGGNMYDRIKGIVPTSNRPLRGGKATMYEGGTREPCIVVWPGKIKPGSRTDALLSSVDWYPTLLEMLGLKAKAGLIFDGVSQVPALLGTGRPRDTVFDYLPHYTPATGNRPAASVRRGDWKLIRFFRDNRDQTDRAELYDLKSDLGETKNLAATEPDRVRELNGLLDGFLHDTHALIPAKNPQYNPNAKFPVFQRKDNPPPLRHGKVVSIRQEIEADSDDGTFEEPAK
jgi:arylsulfatase A-like enzyme